MQEERPLKMSLGTNVLTARGQFALAKGFLFSVNLLQFIQGFKERKFL